MKKKFRKVLADKCADMGLSDKALDTLAEQGSKNLKDDATDEDIANAVDLVVPYAKAMQGEVTRKTQNKPSAKQSDTEEGNGEGETKIPAWFEPFNKRMNDLEAENAKLKEEKQAATRATSIADKAKKLGIPDFLLKGRSFADDADIDKELAEFKQQLVNHNLMPKGQAHEPATSEAQMTSEEDAWAKALPGK